MFACVVCIVVCTVLHTCSVQPVQQVQCARLTSGNGVFAGGGCATIWAHFKCNTHDDDSDGDDDDDDDDHHHHYHHTDDIVTMLR